MRLEASIGGCGTFGCFNPRTREGCDLNKNEDEDLPDLVSIHAPVKGATRDGIFLGSLKDQRFQSTHP
jgi:hypothetical protein